MRSTAIAIAAFCLVLIGCSSSPMVGTWNMEVSKEMKALMESMRADMSGKAEFKGDNTFTVTLQSKGTGQDRTMSLEGTYVLKDKTLTLTATKMDGKEPTGKDKEPVTVTLADDMKSFEMSESGVGGMKFVKQ